MKKYLTAFSMAWGNFCTLPCLVKLWDTDYQSLMLGWLPTVGLVIGALWGGAYLLLIYLGLPFLVISFFMTLIPFILCGFMHLDGFMDCSDAILSRRPLEDRQRILKDSHTGAFAVISVIFLLLGFFVFISTAISQGVDFSNLVLIAVLSRASAALQVFLSKPLRVSQYVKMHESESEEGSSSEGENAKNGKEVNSKVSSKKSGILLLAIQLIIYVTFALLFSFYLTGSLWVMGATLLGSFLAATFGKKQLGGMNGDISGYSIVWGELLGVFALVLL